MSFIWTLPLSSILVTAYIITDICIYADSFLEFKLNLESTFIYSENGHYVVSNTTENIIFKLPNISQIQLLGPTMHCKSLEGGKSSAFQKTGGTCRYGFFLLSFNDEWSC